MVWHCGSRELAKLLRMKPKEVFKSLGGYQEKKMHRIVLSGVPYAFPKLGNIIVPFEVIRSRFILGTPLAIYDTMTSWEVWGVMEL